MRIWSWVIAIILIAILGAGLYFYRLFHEIGAFRTVEPYFNGTCERMAGFAGGTEDLLIDRETGWVLVSAFDRRLALAGGSPRGAIEAFRLGSDEIFDLTPAMPTDFRPHGISLYDGPEGKRLFVISHPADGRQPIEIFDLTYTDQNMPQLTYVEAIEHELFVSPNDLVAVGPRSFYVGNDYQTADRESVAYLLETYLRLNRTNVIYFDGEGARVAAPGLTYANGVNVSADGESLFLGETTDGTVRIYNRDVASGDLNLEAVMRLGTGVDNIDRDAEGRMWVTAHPRLLDVAALAEDASTLSPAQVILLDPSDEGEGGLVYEVYMGTGELAAGSATTVYHDGQMIIGVIFDPHVVVCDVNEPVVLGN